MVRSSAIWVFIWMLSFQACMPAKEKGNRSKEMDPPSVVEVLQTEGTYRLFVNGEPFYVKGAGCEFGDLASLSEHGANSLRTWRIDNGKRTGKEVLDEAHRYNLKVLMGIEVGNERHGFDYNDTAAVGQQLERIREQVLALKDHPALLAWGIGNELNLRYTNVKVWDAVNEISKMIHQVDGYHPTTTMLAGISKEDVEYLEQHGSDLDFLSIQMYGDIINLQQRIADSGYRGPYMVTEWGATGHWEVPVTEWNAPVEPTSTEKAADIRKRYERAILQDSTRCLGSYVFLWGQKQERTPTWYGLFTENGKETEAIETMQYLWSGAWPENRAPQISDPLIDGKTRYHNVVLVAGKPYRATLETKDPDGDALTLRSEILPESSDLGEGGDPETRPGALEGFILDSSPEGIHFLAPAEQGAYRLFVYVDDGNNHAATVNFPFYVLE